MKRFLKWLLHFFILGIIVIWALSFLEPFYTPTGFNSYHETRDLPPIIAHKSYINDLPGNSLEAIQAIMASPIPAIEIDVQLSQDGIPYAFHDDKLDTLTNGHGLFNETTSQQLKNIHYQQNNQQYTIASLAQIFETVGESKMIFIDAKAYGLHDQALADAIIKSIQQYNLTRTVVIESFNPFFLKYIKKQDPHIKVMLDFAFDATPTAEESPEQLAQIPWLLKRHWVQKQVRRWIRPDILGPKASTPKKTLKKLTEYGYPVIVWTVDDPEQAKQLMLLNIHGLQTNHALLLWAALAPKPRYQDASRLIDYAIQQQRFPKNITEIKAAVDAANQLDLPIALAGSRHTMGGHTAYPNAVVINLTKYNHMDYDEKTQLLTVDSGAIWRDIQQYLNTFGRAVTVMQSDNIFTVGGSMSANVHGWQVDMPPIVSTIKSFRFMLADGRILNVSREEHPDLFASVIGGYGLLGIILDVTLTTSPNIELHHKTLSIAADALVPTFQKEVADNPNAVLFYGRLNPHKPHFLEEIGFHVYDKTTDTTPITKPIAKEHFIMVKRAIFRMSDRNNLGKWHRWMAEKYVSRLLDPNTVTRNDAMSPDIHVLWTLKLYKSDILQEYFVPAAGVNTFIEQLRQLAPLYDMNLLNVTIRQVKQDKETLLAYAKQDMFAFVILFSHEQNNTARENMRLFTRAMINDVLKLNGSFYLPYLPDYTPAQLHQAYPNIDQLLALKNTVDPAHRFKNQFFDVLTQA